MAKRRKTPIEWVLLGICLVALGIAGGAAYAMWFAQMSPARFHGEAVGQRVSETQLPQRVLPRAMLEFDQQELEQLLKSLTTNSLPFSSTKMTVEVSGHPSGLAARIKSGSETDFVRVELPRTEDFKAFADAQAVSWEDARLLPLRRHLSQFFKDYRATQQGGRASPLAPYRDLVALPMLTPGISYHLVAQADQRLYPCVFDDGAGGLYFLLPKQTREFHIIGRKDSAGRVLCPVDFHVRVTGVFAESIPVPAVPGSSAVLQPVAPVKLPD